MMSDSAKKRLALRVAKCDNRIIQLLGLREKAQDAMLAIHGRPTGGAGDRLQETGRQ